MAKRIEISDDYIKSLPLTTNRIEVKVDREAFFSKYSIVSYSGQIGKKNIPYEYLSDTPCLSIAGIRARYEENKYPYVKFFVMTEKGKERVVIQSLQKYPSLRIMVDTLDSYPNEVQQRVFASLTINSLGKKRKNRMMYNNGSLYLCDDKNFLIPKSRKELVCLRIEVNVYMNLTAKTASFSNPRSIDDLKKHKYGVFQVGKDIGGEKWLGMSLKPVTFEGSIPKNVNLENYYIQRKRFSGNKNTVPYWPYNPENFYHGKLFAIWQVLESVNEAYSGIVEIKFFDYPVLYYNEYKSGNDMLAFMQEYLKGKSIVFENPFKADGAKKMIVEFKEKAQDLMDGKLLFPTSPKGTEMLLSLCEPKEDNAAQTNYSKSMQRMVRGSSALQHIVFHNNEKEDELGKSEVRRILIELVVKDSLANRVMPPSLRKGIKGWTFYRYKVKDGGVHGASLNVMENGKINFENFGTFNNDILGVSLSTFANEHFHFLHYQKINGFRDYKALTKDGNSYIIIDTDEIPILDVAEIDEGYGDIVNKGEKLSMFKRKKEAHKYLRGYIGFHLWETEGLDGEPYCSYSYISGNHPQNMQILHSGKMDKMPRARRIFILHEENPDTVKDDIHEIADMMRYGFGRWNEEMTYPFPFKYLYEYLDNECEIRLSKHWDAF